MLLLMFIRQMEDVIAFYTKMSPEHRPTSDARSARDAARVWRTNEPGAATGTGLNARAEPDEIRGLAE
jgi:hypothetical protein